MDSPNKQSRSRTKCEQEEVHATVTEVARVVPSSHSPSVEAKTRPSCTANPPAMRDHTNRTLMDFTGYMHQRSSHAIADGGFATVYTGQYEKDKVSIREIQPTHNLNRERSRSRSYVLLKVTPKRFKGSVSEQLAQLNCD
jgi:hypothetical protein